ncbi:baseplate J/gp47 family protein [Listeria fleischmannii]|uniref:Baseplate protein J-like barrel domain-containing protein n=1 Tax=Listeria fleischmannii FSL S10-1203 TaxID=1265822 RepID=W7DFC7_9LIST|nr:baseplate J/gp47 family protein [Listeria fleischmannii]EUJ44028.1 hypothetical protein MCOL2_20076 [Listeria fleischmannii FSL S10-1203]
MLDENGFKRKVYAELLEDMERKAKELFGENLNTSSHSVIGIILRIFAWFLSLTHELAERVYNSAFISTATGAQLDRLGSNQGILRDPEMPALVELEYTGAPGFAIEEGVQFKTANDIIFESVDVVTLDAEGKGKGLAVSQIYSDKANVPASSINIILEPSEDLSSVINPLAASGGSELENDTSYRERIKLGTRASPGPPVNGIISSINQVSGVRSVSVVKNNTMAVDSYNNPPKSVHIYCFGGAKEEIGEAIFNSVAAGIETVGKEQVTIRDLSGFDHEVYFDHAVPVQIYAQVEVTVNSKFEDTGTSDIKQAVYDYINSLNMGEDVIHTFIYPNIYRIEGIVVAIVKVGRSVEGLYSNDITIEPDEVSQITLDNIEVIEHVG